MCRLNMLTTSKGQIVPNNSSKIGETSLKEVNSRMMYPGRGGTDGEGEREVGRYRERKRERG